MITCSVYANMSVQCVYDYCCVSSLSSNGKLSELLPLSMYTINDLTTS